MAEPVAILLHLLHRARDAATVRELAFIAVNETRMALPYRQAVLWRKDEGVVAVSGVATPEPNAPFMLWLEQLCRSLALLSGDGAIEVAALPASVREQWPEWFPAHGHWLRLAQAPTPTLLLVGRDDALAPAEAALLAELGHGYGHALAGLSPTRRVTWFKTLPPPKRRAAWIGVVVVVLVLALFPVRQTVLAPGEVVAKAPVVVRAPMDGIVAHLDVRPNQTVTAGQLLLELDETVLRGRLDVTGKALDTAEAELRQVSQLALLDPASKAKLAGIIGQRDAKQAEYAYLAGQLERSRIKAPAAGTVIVDDPSEWQGRPVSVGERILVVADPDQVEVEAWLSAWDLIALPPGSAVTLFPNANPLDSVAAHLLYVAYEASVRPDGSVAHRVRAEIEPGALPRLGAKGTVRLSGQRTPLLLWLLRRPFAAARSYLGL